MTAPRSHVRSAVGGSWGEECGLVFLSEEMWTEGRQLIFSELCLAIQYVIQTP